MPPLPELILDPVTVRVTGPAQWVSTLDIDGAVYVLPCDGLDVDGLAEQWRRNSFLPDINWQELFKVIHHA